MFGEGETYQTHWLKCCALLWSFSKAACLWWLPYSDVFWRIK